MAQPKITGPAGFDPSHRVVILHGPDEYMRRAHTAAIASALTDTHGEVARFEFDGTTVEAAVLLDELRSYGLLHTHKLVILDHADKFLAVKPDKTDEAPSSAGPPGPKRPRGVRAPKTARALLERYAETPVDSATLVLRAETWRPGKLDRAVAKVGRVVPCKEPDAATAAGFCVERCRDHGATITEEAARTLVERLGPSRSRLDAELGKLASFVGEGGRIGREEVRAIVGLSREEKAWSIQSALLSGSPGRSVDVLRELLMISGQPKELVSWAMIDLLRKLHAGARLMHQGMSERVIADELRLWGPERSGLLKAARRLDPAQAAQLLQVAVEADQGSKSGLGDQSRTLEVLAVRIADTLRCA